MDSPSIDSIRVLHVDDEPDFADMAGEFISRHDERLAVTTVTSASEALDRLQEVWYDCIVSDYDMPGQNGIEFLEEVREEYPELPFILYTGKGSEEIASEAISRGVSEYLQKESGTSQYELLANRITHLVEKQQAESQLRDREERLNLFFEQSPLGVIRWDDEFNFARLNDTARDILGYDEGELVEEPWETVVPDEDLEEIGDVVVDDLLADEGGYHSINENVRKDGERIVCEWHNWVVTDQDDNVVSVFSQFQDITERRQRERRFEAIFNNAHTFVGLMEPDGTLLEANETALSFGDVDRNEVVGDPIWETFWFEYNDEAQTMAKNAVEQAQSGELFQDEIRVRGSDREAIIDFSVRPITDEQGHVELLVPEGRDITELKHRERQLRETKTRLEAALADQERQNQAFDDFLEIVNDETASLAQQITDVLELGVEFLDLDAGIVSRIEPPDYTVEHVFPPDGSIEQGAVLDFTDTYCSLVYEADGPVAFHSPSEGGVVNHPSYQDLGLEAYLGEPLMVDGERYGTLNFTSPTSREEPFTVGEKAFIRTVAQWVSKELQRQEGHQELRRSEERFRALFENAPEPVIRGEIREGGEVHEIRDGNDAFETVFGYNSEEIVGEDVAEVVVPESGQERHAEFREQAAAGEPVTTEVERQTVEGSREFILHIIPFGTQDGLADGWYAWYTDISDQKQGSDRLDHQQSLLEAVIETSIDGILVIDEDRDYVTWNQQFIDMWGIPEELVGDKPEELGLEWALEQLEDPDAFIEKVEYLYEHPHEESRDEIHLNDGRVFDRYSGAVEANDGTYFGRVWFFRDITERKERERTLERERDRLAAIYEAIPEPVVHVRYEDEEPIVQSGNEAFEEVFGLDLSNVTGRSLNEFIVPDDRRNEARDIDQSTRTEQVIEREVERLTADGRREFLFRASMLETHEDSQEGLGIYVDISERREREQAIRREKERLDEFASVISHDLRNPLNVAEGRLELARGEGDSEHLETVAKAHDRMRALIEDVLTLAREGERVSDFVEVNLGKVSETCWRSVETSQASLNLETEQTIVADRSRLQRLLENLMRNAVEHGGNDVTVTVGDLDDGFYVEDDGPGIPEDMRDQVFEAGYSEADDGTGFGLSIVRQITDAHDWTMALANGQAGGARFEITGLGDASR